MEVDRLPDLLGHAFGARVDAAHDALQLGELANHVARQVGFREPCRFRRRRRGLRVGAERVARDPFRELLDPLGLRLVGPELLVEQQRVEAADARLERVLPIFFPEEARVAQPRRDDALGVARDGALVVGLGVDHREKRVLQLPVVALDREIVLVMHERRRQHFVGQLEELRRERAGDDRRVLDQIGHFLQQRRFLARRAAHAALQPLRFRVELARDLVVALAPLENHEVLEEPRAILVERPYLDRAPRAAAGREEPVAVGDGARRHVLHLSALRRGGAADRERHHAAAIDEQNPADRPAEQQLAAPVVERRVPVHRLRERQPAQRAAEDAGQHVHGRLPALPPAKREVVPFRRLHALERRDLYALLRGEAARRWRRLPVGFERGRHRRTVDQLLEIGLPLRNPRHTHGEPPRRAVGFDRGLGCEPMRAQLGADDVADLHGEHGQPAGGQLLAADLEQQLAIHYPPPPAATA